MYYLTTNLYTNYTNYINYINYTNKERNNLYRKKDYTNEEDYTILYYCYEKELLEYHRSRIRKNTTYTIQTKNTILPKRNSLQMYSTITILPRYSPTIQTRTDIQIYSIQIKTTILTYTKDTVYDQEESPPILY